MLLRPPQFSLGRQVPTQPAINRGHRLAGGLIGAWIPGATGGVNLLGTSIPMLAGSGAAFGMDREGAAMVSTAASGGVNALSSSAFLNWATLTLYWRGVSIGPRIGGTSSYIGISYDNIASSPFTVASISNQGTGANAVVSLFWNHGGNFQGTTSTQTLNNNQIYGLGGTFNVNGNTVLYLDGANVASDPWGAGNTVSTSASSQTEIGTYGSVNTRATNCSSFVAYAWNRELTQEEMWELNTFPYDLVSVDASMPIWANSVATGGSFIPAWARNSNLPVIGTGTY